MSQVTLTKGQYANLVVEQRGVDVVARLFSPDGKLIVELDAESRTQGQESLEVVADATGTYKVVVGAMYKLLPAGRYEIRLAELRAATPKEGSLEEARRLQTQARWVFNAGDYDEARITSENLTVGSRVFGNWQRRGLYYPGKITDRRGDTITILYDDGDRETTTIAVVRVKR